MPPPRPRPSVAGSAPAEAPPAEAASADRAGDAATNQAGDGELARLRAETAELRGRLHDLTRLVSDWIWEVDREGVLTAVTDRVLDVLGYHPVELVGRPFAELVGDGVALAGLDRPHRARPFRDVEVAVADRRGNARTFRLAGLPVFGPADGRLLGYRGTAADVTELKAREDALREAKQAAEQANRSKSQFLAQMSHELRTPLNAIIGFSEIMQTEQLGPLGTPQYRDYAGDIATSARHLSQVINDVLDVAKLEAGKFQLQEDVVSAREVAGRAMRIVQPRADQADVTLALDGDGADRMLLADGRKLLQILLNLLSNAVKFTPRGGRVEVAAETDPDGGYRFRVADTGIGMSAADVRVALAPFGQVDSKLSRRYEGTGLGLPLAKALTELHEGRMELDSAPGEGTCMTVVLPAERVYPGG